MNLHEQNKLFEAKYLKDTDNVFEAINSWSNDANNLYSQLNGVISNSESLTYSLTSEIPKHIYQRIPISKVDLRYEYLYIQEALTQVEDKKVKISVIFTLKQSKLEKNLVFVYIDGMSASQKARVRVLSRLIWYNLYPEKGKDDGGDFERGFTKT